MAKRRLGYTPKLVPEYEEEIPVANKITLNPHHSKYERTILLPEPRGAKARKLTVRLLPFLKAMKHFVNEEGEVAVASDAAGIDIFVDVTAEIWGQDNFEEELFPFVLGLDPSQKDDKETLESLTLIQAFEAFTKAFNYLMSGSSGEEFEAASKKLDGGGEGAEDGTS